MTYLGAHIVPLGLFVFGIFFLVFSDIYSWPKTVLWLYIGALAALLIRICAPAMG